MPGGQSSTSYSDDTTEVKLYVPVAHKTAWQSEADDRNTSLSRYCQELIQEARFLRDQGQLKLGDRRQVEQLQQEVTALERQVTAQTQPSVEADRLVEKAHVQAVLSDNYRSVDELLETLLAHDALRQRLRSQLELRLYELGNEGAAAFRRGWGWMRVEGGDE